MQSSSTTSRPTSSVLRPNDGNLSEEVTAAHTIEELEALFNPPAGWELSYTAPKPYLTDPNPESLTMTRHERFDQDIQTHGELHVTGLRVDIRVNEEDRYETGYTPLVGSAPVSRTRVVHTSNIVEAVEWADRICWAVKATPPEWVLMPGTAGKLARWLTVAGTHEVAVYQHPRENLAPRSYEVLHIESPATHGLTDSPTTLADSLNTADLFTDVVPLLDDVETEDAE